MSYILPVIDMLAPDKKVLSHYCYLKEAPHNFFKPMPSSLIGASWLRNSLPYTTIPLLYPHVRVFMAAEAF